MSKKIAIFFLVLAFGSKQSLAITIDQALNNLVNELTKLQQALRPSAVAPGPVIEP